MNDVINLKLEELGGACWLVLVFSPPLNLAMATFVSSWLVSSECLNISRIFIYGMMDTFSSIRLSAGSGLSYTQALITA